MIKSSSPVKWKNEEGDEKTDGEENKEDDEQKDAEGDEKEDEKENKESDEQECEDSDEEIDKINDNIKNKNTTNSVNFDDVDEQMWAEYENQPEWYSYRTLHLGSSCTLNEAQHGLRTHEVRNTHSWIS